MANSVQRTGNNGDFSAEDGKPEMKGDDVSNEGCSEEGKTTNFSENIKDMYYELKDELKQISTTNKFILKRLNEQQKWMPSLSKEMAQYRKNPIKAELGDIVTKGEQARAPSDLLGKVVGDLQLRERDRERELTMMKCAMKTILQKLDRVTGVDSAGAGQPDVGRNEEFDTWLDSVNNLEEDDGILIEEECDAEYSQNRNLVQTHEKDNCDIEEVGKKCFVETESISSSDHMITSHAEPPGEKTIPKTLVTPGDKTMAETLKLPLDGVGARNNGLNLTDCETKLHRSQTVQTSHETVKFTDTELNVFAPSSSKQKTRSLNSEEVPTNIDDADWNAWAMRENEETLSSKCPRSEGIFTVLLLDISASMSGCMKQMKDAVKQFLKGVEKVAIDDSLEENVAIATFGHETRIVQHLTNNYTLLREALETLTSGGRSPLLAGLLMAGSAFTNIEIVGPASCRPRVIVFTDGRITDSHVLMGPDHTKGENRAAVKEKVLNICKAMREKQVKIYCVQFDDFDGSLMFDVTKMTMGKMFLQNDITKLSRTYRSLAFVDKIMISSPGDSISGSNFILAAQRIPGTSMEDVMEMCEIIKERAIGSDNSANGFQETDDPTMLPLGTRVRRGPDWSWGDQGKDTVGTIIGHANDEIAGCVWVQWDNNRVNIYRYGAGQCYDVISVDESRLLKDELIAVGCLVKRGKNWIHSDQDGGKGSIGVVLQVKSSGIIKVRWPSRTQADYRFGSDGHFDVDICDPFEVEDTILAVGGATAGGRSVTETKRKVEKNARKGTLTIEEMNRRNTQCSVNITTSVQPNTETGKINTGSKSMESSQRFETVAEKNDKNTEVVVISDKNTSNELKGHQNDKDIKEKQQTAPAIGQQVTNQTPDKTSDFLAQDIESSSNKSHASSPGLIVASDRNKAEWNWMDATGNWQPYSVDVTKDIEGAFAKRPNSTKIIQLNGEIYRVIFTSMQQVNTTSRQTHNIRRIVITDE